MPAHDEQAWDPTRQKNLQHTTHHTESGREKPGREKREKKREGDHTTHIRQMTAKVAIGPMTTERQLVPIARVVALPTVLAEVQPR